MTQPGSPDSRRPALMPLDDALSQLLAFAVPLADIEFVSTF